MTLLTFNEEERSVLRRVIVEELARLRGKPRDKYGERPGDRWMSVGLTDDFGISARSDLTPGSGTVTPCWIETTTGLISVSGAADVTVYNISTGAVQANTYIIFEADEQGDYWVIVEDCGGD